MRSYKIQLTGTVKFKILKESIVVDKTQRTLIQFRQDPTYKQQPMTTNDNQQQPTTNNNK